MIDEHSQRKSSFSTDTKVHRYLPIDSVIMCISPANGRIYPLRDIWKCSWSQIICNFMYSLLTIWRINSPVKYCKV